CKRIRDFWAVAHGNVGDSSNAMTMLRRMQREFHFDDVELAYIAEYTDKNPKESHITPSCGDKRPINLFEVILHLIEANHIVLPLASMVMVTLWALHTHVFDLFLHTPRLLIRSAKPGCGKTLLMMFLDQLVRDPAMASNMSDAAIYYRLQEF